MLSRRALVKVLIVLYDKGTIRIPGAQYFEHGDGSGVRLFVRINLIQDRYSKMSLDDSDLIGRMIRSRRESIAMTVAELAKAVGVSRNTITNYETGKTNPKTNELSKIASALGSTLQELIGHTEIEPEPRFAFRAHQKTHRNPSVLATARSLLRSYQEIERIRGVNPRDGIETFLQHFDEPISERAIESLAEKVRESSGLVDQGPLNIAGVLEGLGVRCLFFKDDFQGLDGVSVVQGGMKLIMLPDRDYGIERVIFSAAHELGHLVLHPWIFSSDQIADGDSSRDYEKEANVFAGSFLVPSYDISLKWRDEKLNELDLIDSLLLLKQSFFVSIHCLYYRLKDLGLVESERPFLINNIKNRLGIRGAAKMKDLEPEPIASVSFNKNTRFERLVRSALLLDEISVSKVAELLRIPLEDAIRASTTWRRNKKLLAR